MKTKFLTPVPNTGINPKYDLALLQFTSTKDYQLAQLKNDSIYSVGYPFDSNTPRLSIGAVSLAKSHAFPPFETLVSGSQDSH